MKEPLGRPSRGWVENVKVDLKDIEWGGGGISTGLIWLRIGTGGGCCEHGNQLSGSINCWTVLE
jgi:hypothetical protein